jgi:hypothetical protein
MFSRSSRIREEDFVPVMRHLERFEGLINWRLGCFTQNEGLLGRDDQTVYGYPLRMRGVCGAGIHGKHFPVRALRRASHDRMEN